MRTPGSGEPRVAFTARGIALAVHCLRRSRFARRLPAAAGWLATPEVETELLRRLPGRERLLVRGLGPAPACRSALALLDAGIPGTSRHLLARKLWFFDLASRFLAGAPPRRVVILGAGLCGLGIRLATGSRGAGGPSPGSGRGVDRISSGSTVVECDLPGPMLLKRRWQAAAAPGASAEPDRLRFLPVDLRDTPDPAEFLGPAPDSPTLVLAEGLLMYLPADPVARLLSGLARLPGEVHLAFTWLDPDALEDPGSPIARLHRALTRRREAEPFRWAPPPGSIARFLAGHGFRLESTLDSTDLARTTHHHPTRPYGEHLATAQNVHSSP